VQLLTGVRQVELLDLRWSREINIKDGIHYDHDVDLQAAKIHAQKIWVRGEETEPKTACGKRTVDLDPLVVSILRKWKLPCPPYVRSFCLPQQGRLGNLL